MKSEGEGETYPENLSVLGEEGCTFLLEGHGGVVDDECGRKKRDGKERRRSKRSLERDSGTALHHIKPASKRCCWLSYSSSPAFRNT